MIRYSANEAKQSMGRVLESAQRGPVLIEKHKRPCAVVLSVEEYDKLRKVNLDEFKQVCQRASAKARESGLTSEKLATILSE